MEKAIPKTGMAFFLCRIFFGDHSNHHHSAKPPAKIKLKFLSQIFTRHSTHHSAKPSAKIKLKFQHNFVEKN